MSSKQYSYMDNTAIHALLLCSICKKPFVDPVTADDKRFGCRSCFVEYSPSEAASLTPIKEWIIIEMLNGLLVRCTRCGEQNIKRGDLEKHEQNDCKSAIVSCEAADIKCPWRGAREELDEHMNECVFEPLRPAFAEIVMENKQFKEKINHLEIRLDELMGNRPAIEFSIYSINQNLIDFINQCPSHAVIKLQSRKITDQDIDILVQYAIQAKKCSILDVNSNHITYQGALILSKALINNITLEQLYLTNNSISDQGIQSLAQVLSNENRSLKKLGLELNNITDEGVEYLSTMFETNRTLLHLGLSANKISNYGVKLLTNVLAHDETNLEELHLSGNKSINDECMDYLIDLLSHNQSIKILTLRDCHFSEENKVKLRGVAEKKTDFILMV